jgi:hypothetical protein
MPIFRPEKFTVTQRDSLAPSRIFFPTEKAWVLVADPGLKPERSANFAKMQSKPNSQDAIQKTGVSSGSGGRTTTRRPYDAIRTGHPRPPQKMKEQTQARSATAQANAPAARQVRRVGISHLPGRASFPTLPPNQVVHRALLK